MTLANIIRFLEYGALVRIGIGFRIHFNNILGYHHCHPYT
jgi:hypothetical protein